MKQKYMKPAMQEVEIKKVNLLVGSIVQNVGGNTSLKFGGAGTSTTIARNHGGDYGGGDWGEDEE